MSDGENPQITLMGQFTTFPPQVGGKRREGEKGRLTTSSLREGGQFFILITRIRANNYSPLQCHKFRFTLL